MTEACHASKAPAGEACRYHWLVGDQVYLTQQVCRRSSCIHCRTTTWLKLVM